MHDWHLDNNMLEKIATRKIFVILNIYNIIQLSFWLLYWKSLEKLENFTDIFKSKITQRDRYSK